MSVLLTIISREAVRNENMIVKYTKELENLPKGKLIPKKINGKLYYYLYYRDGKKVVSKYIGNDERKLNFIHDQLIRRNQIEDIIKKLKDEKVKIKKMEAML